MVNVLLGVDTGGHYRSALSLIARLGFEKPVLTLLHVDESVSFPVALPSTPVFSGKATPVGLHYRGELLVERAAFEATAAGLTNKTQLEAGDAADQLLNQSLQHPTDLVAIGSRSLNPAAAMILRSVGRILAADSDRSFLIAHGEIAPAGKLKCLFATDHSEFANKALDRLLEWNPAGLGEIVIFHAVEPRHWGSSSRSRSEADELAAKSLDLAKRLRERGIKTTIRFADEDPVPAIDAAMKDTMSDLLILGARGHGFAERLFVGSVVMGVTKIATYPTLVLRPRIIAHHRTSP